MGIQDDYFDVASALGGKPEAAQFERLWEWACRVEGQLQHYQTREAALTQGFQALQDVLSERPTLDGHRQRSYELAVAIMGGEDVPGQAESVPTKVLVEQLRRERQDSERSFLQVLDNTAEVRFWYTNWRGEMGLRRAIPQSLHFGTSEWHKTPCWLLTAHDVDRGAVRQFDLASCNFVGPSLLDVADPNIQQLGYIGDGVYLSHDGYQFWLAVNHHANRVVALEPGVVLNFNLALEQFRLKSRGEGR
jgi:hypothetical protein